MTLDLYWMKGKKGRVKSKKKLHFYSLHNYCMTHIMAHIFYSDSTLQRHPLSLCHCLWACMKTTLLLHSNQSGWTVCSMFVHLDPFPREDLFIKKNRHVTYSDQQESVRRIYEASGVFNMEIGFESHLHRSAHLWAKLCRCWQRKWTVPHNVAWLLSYLPPANLNL